VVGGVVYGPFCMFVPCSTGSGLRRRTVPVWWKDVERFTAGVSEDVKSLRYNGV
jgi:hypothetical protein